MMASGCPTKGSLSSRQDFTPFNIIRADVRHLNRYRPEELSDCFGLSKVLVLIAPPAVMKRTNVPPSSHSYDQASPDASVSP